MQQIDGFWCRVSFSLQLCHSTPCRRSTGAFSNRRTTPFLTTGAHSSDPACASITGADFGVNGSASGATGRRAAVGVGAPAPRARSGGPLVTSGVPGSSAPPSNRRRPSVSTCRRRALRKRPPPAPAAGARWGAGRRHRQAPGRSRSRSRCRRLP